MSTAVILSIGAAAFMLILGAGAALLFGGQNSDVEKRMEQIVGSGGTVVEIPEDTVQATDEKVDVAERLDQAMANREFFAKLKERISKSDTKLRVSEYLVLMVLAAGGIGGIAYLLRGSVIFAIIGAGIGLFIPRFYVSTAASRRMNAFDSQLSDTLNLWVNALRSGYSVLQSMEAIATELPPPMSVEFERVVQEVRLGLSVEAGLDNMYRRVPSEDLDMVITAVNIQREVGGNLAEVLDKISFTIRERVRIKGEVRTLTAQGRISGWIISLLPVVLGFILYLINPDYISELWVMEPPYIWPEVIPCGWAVMAFSGGMIAAGAWAISKIVNIEV